MRYLNRVRRIAGLSVKRLATLIALIAGYGFGVLLFAMALFKPFTPERIGLWFIGGADPEFMLGRTDTPRGEEVLGWWVVPIGLLAGFVMIYFTWRLSLSTLRSLTWTSRQRTQ